MWDVWERHLLWREEEQHGGLAIQADCGYKLRLRILSRAARGVAAGVDCGEGPPHELVEYVGGPVVCSLLRDEREDDGVEAVGAVSRLLVIGAQGACACQSDSCLQLHVLQNVGTVGVGGFKVVRESIESVRGVDVAASTAASHASSRVNVHWWDG